MPGTLAHDLEAATRKVADLRYALHIYRDEPLAAGKVAEQLQAALGELARLQEREAGR